MNGSQPDGGELDDTVEFPAITDGDGPDDCLVVCPVIDGEALTSVLLCMPRQVLGELPMVETVPAVRGQGAFTTESLEQLHALGFPVRDEGGDR